MKPIPTAPPFPLAELARPLRRWALALVVHELELLAERVKRAARDA